MELAISIDPFKFVFSQEKFYLALCIYSIWTGGSLCPSFLFFGKGPPLTITISVYIMSR